MGPYRLSTSSLQSFKRSADTALRRFEGELKRADEGRHYLFGEKPTVADFFLFEALEVYASAFGDPHLLQEFPILVSSPIGPQGVRRMYIGSLAPIANTQFAFRARISDRERISAYLNSNKRHMRFSGSPTEEDVLQAMRALTESEGNKAQQ